MCTMSQEWQCICVLLIYFLIIRKLYHGFERKYSKKRYWPTEWTADLEYQGVRHLAIFDCIEQAHVYFKFRNTNNIG